MDKFIYKSSGNTGFVPNTPTLSRFVSPWDTSGWYTALPCFNIGAEVHSNSDVKVVSAPEKFIGADYIMTFNSNVHGFDDKQELTFFAERDCEVFIAVDKRVTLPDDFSDWTKTDDIIALSDGSERVVYSHKYKDEDLIVVPGISGEGDHYFAIICPTADDTDRKALVSYPEAVILPDCEHRTYKSHINEVFNSEDSLDSFAKEGDVSLIKDSACERNMLVCINGGGSLTKKFEKSTRVIGSALVTPHEGGSCVVCSFLDENGDSIASAFIENGYIFANSKDTSKKIAKIAYGKETDIKVVLNSDEGYFDLWIGCRVAAKNIKTEGVACEFGFFSDGGKLLVDNVSVYDDTDVFVYDVTGKTLCGRRIRKSKNAKACHVDVPFKSAPSLSLTSKDGGDASAFQPFPAVEGVGTYETKLKASSRDFVKTSLITPSGEACAVALYKNSLFVSNGDEWCSVYVGLTDWLYYPSENQILIKIVFDTAGGVFDVWVDGALRAKGMKMNACGKIVGAGFYTSAGTELLIGKIRVYDDADLCRGVIPCGKVFDVKAAPYNAVGDGKTLDTAAIQRALDDAAYTGGTVLVKGGTFLCGELFLRSDETVFVDRDATILGTQDHGDYPLQEPRSSLCAHRQLGRGLLYGHDISNIRITGGGMLDGNGRYRFKMNDPRADRRELDARPDIIYISYSKNIVVENINLKSSAFWTVVPLSSGNIIIKNLYLDCMNTPNRDGIDPVDCHDITVCGCAVMAGDDGLCFKSSDPVGCYNIDVHDMMIQSLASGIKFGTDTYYCLENAKFKDCTIKNVNRCGISLEAVDGAYVGDVVFERIEMTDVSAPAYITVGARNRLPRGIDVVRSSRMDGVLFKDIRFEKRYLFGETRNICEVMAVGQSDEQRLDNVTFENCNFELTGGFDTVPEMPRPINNKYPEYDRHGLSAGHAFTVRFANNFKIKNCKIKLLNPDVRPMVATFDCDKE